MLYAHYMATAVTEMLLTAEEFAELPEPREGGKMELVGGKVVTFMPVSGKHGELQGLIWHALRVFLENTGLGKATVETGYILRREPDLVRGPDVSIAPLALLPAGRLPDSGFIQGPPLLAIEVVSPNDTERDVLEKVGEYLDAGVQRVWLVRSRHRDVVVYRADGGVRAFSADEHLTSEDAGLATPGLDIPIGPLFD